jgi:hypothetical protein
VIVRQQRRLSDQLDSVQGSLASYLQLRAENVLVLRPTDPVETEVQIRKVADDAGTAISGGPLALFVRAGQQRFRDVVLGAASSESEATVRFPLAGDAELRLAGEGLGEYGPRLDVVAAFRGHEI